MGNSAFKNKKEVVPNSGLGAVIGDIGKVPPQAIDLEQVVLGAILLETDAIIRVYNDLRPEIFYKDAHRKIYEAILSLYEKKAESIDILTVTDELRNLGTLDEIGGPVYITELTSRVASTAHLQYHVTILKEKSFLREMIRISSEVNAKSFENGSDPIEVVEYWQAEFDKALNELFGARQQPSFPMLLDQAKQEYYVREALAKDNKMSGIPTPIVDLTAMTNGWQNGEMTVLAGRPGSGKSAILLAISKTAAYAGKNVAIFSLEMPGVRLVDRMLCGVCGFDPSKFMKGLLNASEKAIMDMKVQELKQMGIYIDDNASVNMDYILNRAKMMKKMHGLDILLLDYLQLVTPKRDRNRNRETEVAEMSRKAKLIAKELDIPVIILAQLNRQCEMRGGMKRPQLSDLRESGSLEQDSDNVILIYRAEYYKFEEYEDHVSSHNLGELIIAKQRNGKTGTVRFAHNDSLTQIFDYVDGVQVPQQASFDVPTDQDITPNAGFESDKPPF